MSEWIRVEDGLPTKGRSKKQWQVYLANGRQGSAWFDGSFFSFGNVTLKTVTHWMPLPSGPDA